jgi:hypothetical protein
LTFFQDQAELARIGDQRTSNLRIRFYSQSLARDLTSNIDRLQRTIYGGGPVPTATGIGWDNPPNLVVVRLMELPPEQFDFAYMSALARKQWDAIRFFQKEADNEADTGELTPGAAMARDVLPFLRKYHEEALRILQTL